MGAAAAGFDSEFYASAGAATTPNSAAAIVTPKIRLVMKLLPAIARADELACVSMALTMAKSRKVQGHKYGCPRPPAHALRGPGESYSDVILKLAAVGPESLNRS